MKRIAILPVLALAAGLVAQPPTTSWRTYHGDDTGRRFSPLTRINDKNIRGLAPAWSFRAGAGGSLKSTPLMVDGILYFTAPDHVWAVDARSGTQIWHKAFETKGGWHIGNRGVGITGNWLFFLTPDCQIISLNLKDGSERWRKQNCDLDQFYYGSMAPMIVKNKVIAGVSGDDLDRPGYLTAYDPETGDQKWRWSVVPLKKGDPGRGRCRPTIPIST
jgi:alcohol dehydrogenase (cytochrome c)